MSLSLALSSALSGISLSARGTQLVAGNIANAQTEGYGVRSLTQASQVLGGQGNGVVATGIRREIDRALLADLRAAQAQKTGDDTRAQFWARVETAFGVPGETGSVGNLVTLLDTRLQRAVAEPSSQNLLLQVTQTAQDITRKLNALHETVQTQRDTADAAIARDVTAVNAALDRIATLNDQIQRQTLMGGAPESLMDARQRLVDEVSEIISIQEIPRADGRIMLMGRDGTVLVDRKAVEFGFNRSLMPEAADSIAGGGVSNLSIDGRAALAGNAMFGSGRIGANLDIRDAAAPAVQNQIDALAHDLVARFMQPAVDDTLTPEDFGLFTLNGVTGLPADTLGLAGRLGLNPRIDPGAGGEVWRLRSGIGLAVEPGQMAHDNALLVRLRAALVAPAPLSGAGGNARSVPGHAADALSYLAGQRLALDQKTTANSAQTAALREAFAAGGVDTDAELSKLLVLEQAYAANARVLATVDAMWRSILEIR